MQQLSIFSNCVYRGVVALRTLGSQGCVIVREIISKRLDHLQELPLARLEH